MGEWKADQTADLMVEYRVHNIYFWVVPANASGQWRFSQPSGLPSIPFTLNLQQKFQEIEEHVTSQTHVIRLKTGRRAQRRPFESTPAQPVTRITAGPMQTLAAGFRDGTVGLWNRVSGKRLTHISLHGPVRFLRVFGQKLYAATELGDTASVDLSLLHQSRCHVLRQMWRRYRAIWDRGRAIRRRPPRAHPCNTPSGGR